MKRSPAHRLTAETRVDDFAYLISDPLSLPKARPLFAHLADSPSRAVPYEQPIHKLVSWQGNFINVTLSAPILVRKQVSRPPVYRDRPFYLALDHAVDLWIKRKALSDDTPADDRR